MMTDGVTGKAGVADGLRLALVFGAMVAMLFGSAGRWDLPFFWACLGVYAVFMTFTLWRMDPELRRERMRPGPGGKDRAMRIVLLPLIVGHWVVAGLDVGRYHWSDTVPRATQAAALVGFALGLGFSVWALTVNRFFSPVVRIQSERGHRLVTDGPYRYVRHPGYLGGMVCFICGGLSLGSWWAMGPVAGCLVIFLRRTIIEDAFLRVELEGYADYAEKVRYRLLPGVW